jgi:acetyltransferase-like isoleucine patch superfamily enzyme
VQFNAFDRVFFKVSFFFHRCFKRLNHRYRIIKNERLKLQLASCGQLVGINGEVYISHPHKVHIGNNVHIGDKAYWVTPGGLYVGDNTHISRNVTIYTANHEYNGKALPYDDDFRLKPVVIGKNVWIGMNVSIVPGVKIHEGAIIGMGVVVASDVEPLAVVVGAPQRILKTRDERHYAELQRRRQYGGINGRLLENSQVDW